MTTETLVRPKASAANYDVGSIRADFPILSREVNGANPGNGYIRVAMVAEEQEM